MTPVRMGTAAGWAEAPPGPGVAAADGGEARVDLAGAVMAALAGVRDPELDESVTELGFVDAVIVSGGRVEVSLRLPTYFCAPNFVWLMVDDAHAALRAIPGVREVLVRLVDHFAADEINAGLRGGQGFEATFAGLADGELDELRDTFRRKALAARQDRMCRMLLVAGATPGDLAERRVGDLPPGPDTDTYLQRRAELGIDVSPEAPFLVDRTGAPVSPERVTPYLRRLRTVAVSIEGNAGFCRGLLATRYPAGQQPGLQPARRGGDR